MKRKILFTVTNDLSYDQRMIRIATTLAQNGFDVSLIGRIKKQSISLGNEPFQQKRLGVFFSKGKLFYLEYNLRLFFFLLKNRFDIVGSVDLDTLLPCFLVAKIKRKPIVFDAHEYFTEVPEVVNRPFTKGIWKLVGNLIIPRLKYAYTVSASLQQLFSEKYKIPFQLIRNITAEVHNLNTSKATKRQATNPIILYQGVLNKGRGLPEIIEAMSTIPMAELWLAGEGDLSTVLRTKVKKLQLEERVKFLGYLSPKTLKEITPKATIGLNLIDNKGLSYYYSLANKTFDYMHAGVPAIHLNFPEYQAIFKEIEIGVLIDNLKKETLINAVNLLLNDKVLYQNIQYNCLKGKTIFNWDKEALKLIEFYNEIGSSK